MRKSLIPAEKIKLAVANRFHLSTEELEGPRRDAGIVYARHLAMYLCRQHTIQSLPRIARLFGDRDHSTVYHAVKKMERIQSDPDVQLDLAELKQTLTSP